MSSDPHDSNVQFTRYTLQGAEAVSTYCEEDPQVCCAGTPGCGGVVAEPGNTRPIIGWCVEYTTVQVPASAVSELLEYCVTDPTDCCPGSSSGSGSLSGSGTSGKSINLNDNGQGVAGVGGTIVGLNVQKTVMNLPPGSVILGKHCVFNPVDCCPGSGSSSSGSVPPPPSPGSGSIPVVPQCIIQDCTGCEPIPSQCNGLFMSSQIQLSWSGVANIPGLPCQTCEFNNSPPFDSLVLRTDAGVCEWGAVIVLECNDAVSVETAVSLFYNAGTLVDGECTSDYPLGYWILRFNSGTYQLVWAIADAAWSCDGTNVFGPENFVSATGLVPCDWTNATIIAEPVFDCPIGPSGSVGSGSLSGSSGSGSSGSGSSGSGSIVEIVTPCCPNGVPSVLFGILAEGTGGAGQCTFFEDGFFMTYGTYTSSTGPVTGWFVSHTYPDGNQIALVLSCSGSGPNNFGLTFYCNTIASGVGYTIGPSQSCNPPFFQFKNNSGTGQPCKPGGPFDCVLVNLSQFTITEE